MTLRLNSKRYSVNDHSGTTSALSGTTASSLEKALRGIKEREALYGSIASKSWLKFLSFFGPFGRIGPFRPYLLDCDATNGPKKADQIYFACYANS